jgi:hypothetical protein
MKYSCIIHFHDVIPLWYNTQEDRAPKKQNKQYANRKHVNTCKQTNKQNKNTQKTRRNKKQHVNKQNNNTQTETCKQNNNRKQQHNLRGILNDTLMCVLYTGTQIRRRIRTSNRSFNQSAIIYTLLDEQSRLSDCKTQVRRNRVIYNINQTDKIHLCK